MMPLSSAVLERSVESGESGMLSEGVCSVENQCFSER